MTNYKEKLGDRKIIIVDDDDKEIGKIFFLNNALCKLGFDLEEDIVRYSDGKFLIEDMAKGLSFKPAFVIMDQDMPKSNGYETIEVIRKSHKYSQLIIVGNSANFGDQEYMNKMEELGVSLFLNPKELMTSLKKVLNKVLK